MSAHSSAVRTINSDAYWDQRFATDWETCAGPDQSVFFAELALAHLPPWLLPAIREQSLTVTDWGCAQGDGTQVWASHMDPHHLVGIDFSSVATAQARQRYPQLRFQSQDWLPNGPPAGEQHDVVFSSNTLEHFEHPLQVLQTLARAARQAVVLALPYREVQRIAEHFATFLPENLPATLANGFRLAWARVVDCTDLPHTQWAGEQIVAVYARPGWLDGLHLCLADVQIGQDDPQAAAARWSRDLMRLRAELVQVQASVAQHRQQAEQTTAALQALRDEHAQLRHSEQALHEQLDRLQASRSWTLTAPLRTVARRWRDLQHQQGRYQLYKSLFWKLPEAWRHGLRNWRRRYVERHQRLGWTRPAAALPMELSPAWVLAARQHRKIAVVPCGFAFDETVNQRPINAAKHFAAAGYFVLFVAWQWQRGEGVPQGCAPVWPQVYQVPLYDFLEGAAGLPGGQDRALYLLTLPAPPLVQLVPVLRARGFAIVYDIMDEWEAFSATGQAPWYLGDVEDALVLQADCVTAVAPSLVAKFAHLRKDIELIGNGHSPALLGTEARGIAHSQPGAAQRVGYVGHLTDAWFDWPLVFEMADRHPEVQFDIIGYGDPPWVREPAGQRPNLRLLGKVHPHDLQAHVRGWRCAWIPFKEGTLAQAVDPIKIYEYLYFGLPTFVTGIAHLQRYPGVTVAERARATAAFAHFLGCAALPTQDVDRFLQSATWQARFDALIALLEQGPQLKDLYGA
jgi:SAM-dependent methyltransferase